MEGNNLRRRRRRSLIETIYTFAIAWIILNMFLPVYEILGFLAILAGSCLVAYFFGKGLSGIKESLNEKKLKKQLEKAEEAARRAEEAAKVNSTSARVGASQQPKKAEKKSYGPEIDPIIEEGNRALSEMGRLYMSIPDNDVRIKINEIMRITDKIMQDAIQDPSDIPQIKKFFKYYLPTTIKLLNAYDRMSAQEIEGENIDKSMKNINEMLDVAIDAYKKRLDSLFANQALDIETDIDVMNQMLAREGLTENKDFNVQQNAQAQPQTQTVSYGGSAAQAQQVQKGI